MPKSHSLIYVATLRYWLDTKEVRVMSPRHSGSSSVRECESARVRRPRIGCRVLAVPYRTCHIIALVALDKFQPGSKSFLPSLLSSPPAANSGATNACPLASMMASVKRYAEMISHVGGLSHKRPRRLNYSKCTYCRKDKKRVCCDKIRSEERY